MAARVMWNVTLLVTGVAMSEQIARSLAFWITYNMAGRLPAFCKRSQNEGWQYGAAHTF